MENIKNINELNKKHIAWVSWICISILSLITYIQNPIRFSSKGFLEIMSMKITYSYVFNKLKYIILILNLLLGLLLVSASPIFLKFKYWFIIITILSFIIIYEFKSYPIIHKIDKNITTMTNNLKICRWCPTLINTEENKHKKCECPNEKKTGRFNIPPSYIKKNNSIYYIIIILLLLYHFISNYRIPIQMKFMNIILWGSIIINLIIQIYLLIKIRNFTPCYYELPVSWS